MKRASYLLCLTLLVGGQLSPVVYRRAEGIEYLVIFDVTLSMATEDYTEGGLPRSRLEVAKDLCRQVLPGLPAESRVTLAGFAGNNVQVFLLSRPVRDVEAIEAALSVLEWDNVWEVGSRIDMALRDIAAQA
ncbi:MAG: VWA domain-containing protein, partial [Gemmatimonadales bacterium]|nr:VWA domain-containing protein [Gemmatimonadales bacterium]